MAEQRTTERKKMFLEAYKRLMHISESAKEAGVTRKTIYQWKEKDADFADAMWDIAEAKKDNLETKMYARALEGSDTMLIWMSKTQMRDRGYIEKQEIAHEGLSQLVISHVDAKEPKVNGK